jgi:two-component system, OmpR family, response regulator ChvI
MLQLEVLCRKVNLAKRLMNRNKTSSSLSHLTQISDSRIVICIVDDECDTLMALKYGLEETNGFQIDAFDDPLLALDNFKPDLYDLVILDIKMPKMNGFSLYREFRKIDSKAKICFLTAGEIYHNIYEDIFRALGESCFIRKPIENNKLLQRIEAMLRSEGLTTSNRSQ